MRGQRRQITTAMVALAFAILQAPGESEAARGLASLVIEAAEAP